MTQPDVGAKRNFLVLTKDGDLLLPARIPGNLLVKTAIEALAAYAGFERAPQSRERYVLLAGKAVDGIPVEWQTVQGETPFERLESGLLCVVVAPRPPMAG